VAISLIDHVLSATSNDDRVTRHRQQQQQQCSDVMEVMLARDVIEHFLLAASA